MLAKIKDKRILKIKNDLEDALRIRHIPIYNTDRIKQRACIMGFGLMSIIYLNMSLIGKKDYAEIRGCMLHELLHYKFNHILKLFLVSIFLPWLAKKKVIQYEAQTKKEEEGFNEQSIYQ